MADCKGMYLHLFNEVTDALFEINHGLITQAESRLKLAQLRCEELFEETETDIVKMNTHFKRRRFSL